ncbi:hypothetical protein ACIGMX_32550 [Streptomyces aquilus]|uniref:Tetratricopeptide repeat protein n=1 Tax=Streptomyces aquilus TaxID=2548456 RepID=A0A3S9HSS4_9ACTN|nr:tetratricopeptide repeat protein [Streptomyces aquilus]AZP15170.1 tetratricopeptide repeat protein [Streptomyces aquilus]
MVWRRGYVKGWWLIVGAAVATSVAAFAKSELPAGVGAVFVAAVGAAAGVASWRGSRLLEAPTARERGLVVARRGRIPRVRDIDDLSVVRVHGAGGDAFPAFIPRDKSGEIEAALASHRFVLLVGDSTAGKSRAAFEALRETYPSHRLLIPDPESGANLAAAFETAESVRPSVIWLDDLERYLTSGSTLPHLIRNVIMGRPGVLVVATIRAHERARFRGIEASPVPEGTAAVFGLAHEIRLDRRWSTAELRRASEHKADERIARAIESSGTYGIAEYLAAGPWLLATWRDARSPEGNHSRGAALVAAAADAFCAGWTTHVPVPVLRDLHEHHLLDLGGARAHPEPWESALAWATKPIFATSSLLLPHHDGTGYRVFDYLPEVIDAERGTQEIPQPVWDTLIAHADAATCIDLGWTARRRTQWDAATSAFRKALDGGALMGASGLAEISGNAARYSEAVDVLTTVLRSAPPDTAPDDLLELTLQLAWWTGQSGDLDRAVSLASEAYEGFLELHGGIHPATIRARRNLIRWTGHIGSAADALAMARELLDAGQTLWGPEHPEVLGLRFEVAGWAEADGPQAAERAWRELDDDASRLLGDRHALTNDARWNLAGWVTRNGDPETGLRLQKAVVEGAAALYGADHPRTLTRTVQLAAMLGHAGRADEALITATAAREDCARVVGQNHELTHCAAYQLALWTALSGDPGTARAIFTRLLSVLPDGHPLAGLCTRQTAEGPGSTTAYYLPPDW